MHESLIKAAVTRNSYILADPDQAIAELVGDIEKLRERMEREEATADEVRKAQAIWQYHAFCKAQKRLEEIALASGSERESVHARVMDDLEVIVLAKYRPALVIEHDLAGDGYLLQGAVGSLGTVQSRGQRWDEIIAPVVHRQGGIIWNAQRTGRLEVEGTQRFAPRWLGTCFLRDKRSAITNRHVLREGPCFHDANGVVRWEAEVSLGVNWEKLRRVRPGTNPQQFLSKVKSVPYLAAPAQADCGLVELAEEYASPLEIQWEPLAVEELKGRLVYVIGHPGPDSSENPTFINMVFDRRQLGCKHVMLGQLHATNPLAQVDGLPALVHDCSTLKGTSGSCVIDLGPADRQQAPGPSFGKVIGLNSCGNGGMGGSTPANYALPTWELPKIFKDWE